MIRTRRRTPVLRRVRRVIVAVRGHEGVARSLATMPKDYLGEDMRSVRRDGDADEKPIQGTRPLRAPRPPCRARTCAPGR